MPTLWKYEIKELREDVEVNLPDNWTCIVAKVTSGDSGKPYWVQVMSDKKAPTQVLAVCQCPEGYFKAPLTMIGLRVFFCKHVVNLLAFLKEREK
jgi:hypothetical protein